MWTINIITMFLFLISAFSWPVSVSSLEVEDRKLDTVAEYVLERAKRSPAPHPEGEPQPEGEPEDEPTPEGRKKRSPEPHPEGEPQPVGEPEDEPNPEGRKKR